MEATKIRSNEDLIEALCQGERIKYLFFWGHKETETITKTCLSQWYPAAFKIDGVLFPTAEHYMMAEKAKLFGDEKILKRVLEASHPSQAKKLGRQIANFDDRKWNSRRFDAVVEGNVAKFGQNAKLKEFLLNTGNRVLVEASPYDRIWGIGMAQDHRDIENPENWCGLNLLGYALMEAREILANSNHNA